MHFFPGGRGIIMFGHSLLLNLCTDGRALFFFVFCRSHRLLERFCQHLMENWLECPSVFLPWMSLLLTSLSGLRRRQHTRISNLLSSKSLLDWSSSWNLLVAAYLHSDLICLLWWTPGRSLRITSRVFWVTLMRMWCLLTSLVTAGKGKGCNVVFVHNVDCAGLHTCFSLYCL